MKARLRRLPGLVAAYRHVQLLSAIAYERWWTDPQRANDRSILDGEWNFEAPSEQERYQQVLAAVTRLRGPASWGDVLEIGCAEGLFTTELVARSASVAACDVSTVACERTVRRWPDVYVRRLNIETDLMPGPFDITFAMCVLVYVHGRGRLDSVGAKLAGTLRKGGLLVLNELRLHDARMEDCWWARWLGEGGLQLMRFLDGRHGLHLIHHEIHSGYVIGIYEKRV